jgi:hypothetical protein
MPRFEVHIPAADRNSLNVTLRVDADTWMAALRTGLHKLGEQGSSVQDVLVDIQGDGSVHVTESRTGRVFQIWKIGDGAPEKPTAGLQPLPLTSLAKPQADSPATLPAIPLDAALDRQDQHPTLLDLPPPLPRPGSSPGAIASRPGPAKPAGPVPSPPSPTSPQKRDSSGWPWESSLSSGGDIEGARARPHSSRSTPPPRTPSGGSRLQPSTVVELEKPTEAFKGQIGRTLDAKKHPRAEIEDALCDVFERVQGVYAQASEQSALYLLLDLALEKIQAESGSVLMSNAGTGDLAFAAARGPKAAELLQARFVVPPGQGIAGFCAAEGVSVALSDVERDPRWHSEVSERLKYQTKSVLCAPMMTHGRSFGCMQLINRKGGDAFTEHEIGMLAYIAHQGALYLNSRT